ncbi:MAG: hypothetical protein ABR506_04930 [Candidatus Krumholzibacteriia bacterium]
MKARQFCSVCKQWLDMEVVPTGDGDEDDGVIWFRCPRCQGFLPKLGGGDPAPGAEADADAPAAAAAGVPEAGPAADPDDTSDDDPEATDLPWESPADMMAARDAGESTDDVLRSARRGASALAADDEDEDEDGGDDDDAEDTGPGRGRAKAAVKEAPAEPIAEYAAQLAAADSSTAVPYRPSGRYAVGQCVHHLAWEDCGVVVAKEALPGGRRAIKCYFASAGVVRLIEEAPE